MHSTFSGWTCAFPRGESASVLLSGSTLIGLKLGSGRGKNLASRGGRFATHVASLPTRFSLVVLGKLLGVGADPTDWAAGRKAETFTQFFHPTPAGTAKPALSGLREYRHGDS